MEYRDFVEQVKEQIQDFLPEKFADAAVEVNQIVKNNDCVLDGLMVRTEESNIAPTIYLNPYFEQIQDGAELDDVLAQIASVYQSHYIDHDIDVSAVTDFDKIKEKIVCKLINEEANKQFLQDKPYSKLEDLAVVYQILMDKTGEGTATITITDNLMDGYGITLEELQKKDEKTGEEIAVEDYDWDKITKAVKSFVEDYNDVVKEAGESNTKDVLRNASWMTGMTDKNSNMLAKIGITIGKGNKLELDEDALKQADISSLKTMFTGYNSFVSKISQKATGISNAANRASATYTNNGTYSKTDSYLTSSKIDKEV